MKRFDQCRDSMERLPTKGTLRRRDFAALAPLAFTGCARTAVDATLPEVRLAVGGQAQFVYLPTTLARQLGFYQAERLQVTLLDFQGGSKALEALLGGSADVVSGFYDHTIQMAAEGKELQAFVCILRSPGFVLAVSPARDFRRIEDLKGATIGVTAPGSSSHMLLNYVLSKHGLTPDSVSVTGIGSAATAFAAVARGKVDAAILFDPAITQVQKKHPDLRILADARGQAGVRDIFGTADYPASVLYSTTGWIRKNPDTAKRLARALCRTLAWMQKHSAEEIAGKMPPEYLGEDRALYIDALRRSMHIYSPDGRMPADAPPIVRQVLAASNEKVRSAAIDLAATYTNDLLPHSR
jgi:NitT/TauT family transport system substrate-binding protein